MVFLIRLFQILPRTSLYQKVFVVYEKFRGNWHPCNVSGNRDIIRGPTVLGSGVICPFPSFSPLIGAGLFWELQGPKAGESGHMSHSQEVGPEGRVVWWEKRGRLRNTSNRDNTIPEKDPKHGFVFGISEMWRVLLSPQWSPHNASPSCHCEWLPSPQQDIRLVTPSLW